MHKITLAQIIFGIRCWEYIKNHRRAYGEPACHNFFKFGREKDVKTSQYTPGGGYEP